jgi:DNA-binding protein H-NS
MELQALLKQKADIDRQIELHRTQGKSDAIAKIRELMIEHGLTVADLTAPSSKGRKVGSPRGDRKPVAVKYKDDQGNKWTGRGLKPKWLTTALAAGKRLEDFTA